MDGTVSTATKRLVEVIAEQMMRVLKNFKYRSQGVNADQMPNVMLCANDTNLMEIATNDKFVRYFDKTNSKSIILNLMLNRFEHLTPAVTRLLSIDYDDFQPPKSMRFNEIKDDVYECSFERRWIELLVIFEKSVLAMLSTCIFTLVSFANDLTITTKITNRI